MSGAKSAAEGQTILAGAIRNGNRGGGNVAQVGEACLEPAREPALLRPAVTSGALLQGRRWKVLRFSIDASLLFAAVAVASSTVGDRPGSVDLIAWFFPAMVLALLASRGMYRQRIEVSVLDGIARLLGATSLAAMAVLTLSAFVDSSEYAGPLTLRSWFFGTTSLVLAWLLLTLVQREARIRRVIKAPTLILGAGQVGAHIERHLRQRPALGLEPVGYVDGDPPPSHLVPGRRLPVLGPPSNLPGIVAETNAQHVILAFCSSRGADGRLIPLVRQCRELGLQVSFVPRFFESINGRLVLDRIGPLPVVELYPVNPKSWQFAIKYASDRFMAALLLLAMSPLVIVIAAAVRLSMGRPVLYRQPRVGRDGRRFTMLKFRTMNGHPELHGEADADWAIEQIETLGGLAPPESPAVNGHARNGRAGGGHAEDRRTRLGRLLRRTCLDELPQLLNVLRGEMSLVGPRPERPGYAEEFARVIHGYGERHRVKSGMTGWAQVHGLRGGTSLSDRVDWDNYYIENWSLGLDLKVLLMTPAALVQFHE